MESRHHSNISMTLLIFGGHLFSYTTNLPLPSSLLQSCFSIHNSFQSKFSIHQSPLVNQNYTFVKEIVLLYFIFPSLINQLYFLFVVRLLIIIFPSMKCKSCTTKQNPNIICLQHQRGVSFFIYFLFFKFFQGDKRRSFFTRLRYQYDVQVISASGEEN